MSTRMVSIAIGRLLTDERLRVRLLIEPIETLADLRAGGIDLTPGELDLFIRTDARIWFWHGARTGDLVH